MQFSTRTYYNTMQPCPLSRFPSMPDPLPADMNAAVEVWNTAVANVIQANETCTCPHVSNCEPKGRWEMKNAGNTKDWQWWARQGSNLQPSASKADALSN